MMKLGSPAGNEEVAWLRFRQLRKLRLSRSSETKNILALACVTLEPMTTGSLTMARMLLMPSTASKRCLRPKKDLIEGVEEQVTSSGVMVAFSWRKEAQCYNQWTAQPRWTGPA